MRLTKDEARILAAAISEYKYEIINKQERELPIMAKLNDLEDRLSEFGKDKRRVGRKSQNDWHDLLKRFALTAMILPLLLMAACSDEVEKQRPFIVTSEGDFKRSGVWMLVDSFQMISTSEIHVYVDGTKMKLLGKDIVVSTAL